MNETLASALSMGMSVLGGLGIFMLGMKYMSEGMQAVAGGSLRKMISLVTDNRLLATAAGTAVTVVVQSSSVTTVIVVGLVNAGLMQLHQAIGVILGANIGTTITGWILVLKIGKYGLPILGAGALAYLFSRRDKIRFIGMAVMGIGMIFFGLELMKDGFAPMADDPKFIEAFAWFDADTYLGVLKSVAVGCVLTFLVQSSSATLGITIGLASTGVIPFTTAAALVLGENIGTTITVVLASIGGNTSAKRTAAAHVMFNVFGVFWITLIFQWYVRVVAEVIESVRGIDLMTTGLTDVADPLVYGAAVTAGIALAHSGFNVTNTLLFLPFLKPFTGFLQRIVPEPRVKEVSHLRHLDARTVDAPVLGLEQSRGEVVQMGRGSLKMMDWIREIAFGGREGDKALVDKTFHREDVLDNIHREVVTFITELLDGTVPRAVAGEGQEQLRIAHEFESLSDRLAGVLTSYLRLGERELTLSEVQREALLDLHDDVTRFLEAVTEAYASRRVLPDPEVDSMNDALRHKVRKLRDDHLQQLVDSPVDPSLSMILTDILTDYRRVRAHILNIHEAVAMARAAGVEA